ncbi:hypothetical protein RU639_005064 [Aspergillus parasiticus]
MNDRDGPTWEGIVTTMIPPAGTPPAGKDLQEPGTMALGLATNRAGGNHFPPSRQPIIGEQDNAEEPLVRKPNASERIESCATYGVRPRTFPDTALD